MEVVQQLLSQFYQVVITKNPTEHEIDDLVQNQALICPITHYQWIDEVLYSWCMTLAPESGAADVIADKVQGVSDKISEKLYAPFEESMVMAMLKVPSSQLVTVITANAGKFQKEWEAMVPNLNENTFKPILVGYVLSLSL